jgi:hypothetical protein
MKFILIIFSIYLIHQEPTTVNGYIKKNGKVVKPHIRTSPNNTQLDNYSYRPNYNPNTGKKGRKKAKY